MKMPVMRKLKRMGDAACDQCFIADTNGEV